VGGARTALFNWLFARRYDGKFLLRIEDTDKARSTEESTRAIFDGLNWLGLTWDEDVVFQGANAAQHKADAYKLLESGHAYRDFTTAAELDAMRAAATARGDNFRFDRERAELAPADLTQRLDAGTPFAIRFRVPDGETTWTDLVHGDITFPNKDIDDFVILRSDGSPVYNHAVVSDDIAMRITHVMRGDDHISNTPKQIMLYRALGAPLPEFAHLPMIHGTDGKKLSKRHGAAAVGDWQHLGILPQAMENFLALLGWSPGNDVELMSQAEMIAAFDASGLLKKPSVFDPKKLEWMNGQHIMRLSGEELIPFLTATPGADWIPPDRGRLASIIELCKSRARTTLQLAEHVRPFFVRPDWANPNPAGVKLLSAPSSARYLTAAREAITAVDASWTMEAVHAALHPVPEALGAKAGEVFQPLRAALTGTNVSPEIYAVVFHMGREESIARIESALRTVS